jgi:Protein tyrosine and serine/threonine kinase
VLWYVGTNDSAAAKAESAAMLARACHLAASGLPMSNAVHPDHLIPPDLQVTHMPPELLSEGQLSKAADVYSFGVMLWEL